MISTDRDWLKMTMAVYVGLVADRIHFAQAAYRDGEWYCMIGQQRGGNCNGERYHPDLGAMLRQTLLEPVGQWCVFWWPHDTKGVRVRKQAVEWLAKHQPNVRWIPDRPIGRANEAGEAAPFWRACRTRRVVLVGPRHLEEGLDLFPVAEHVLVPDAVAWQHLDRLCDEIRGVLRGEDELVLFASGMATNVMIWRLWPELRGKATLLDVGASLDPYVGHFSRGEYKSPEWQCTLMPRNLP